MEPRLTNSAGFSLIELMVAVTVLALLSTTVVLSVNRPGSAGRADLARFEALHERLRDKAILSRQVLGVELTPEGYQEVRRNGSDWVPNGASFEWQDDVVVLTPSTGRVARLIFAPSGQHTPVIVRFKTGGESSRVCESNGWSGLACRPS